MSKFLPLGGNEREGELLRRSKRSRPGAYGACADEVQDKAVASPQLTSPRSAGRECRKTAGLCAWIVDYDHDIILPRRCQSWHCHKRKRLETKGFAMTQTRHHVREEPVVYRVCAGIQKTGRAATSLLTMQKKQNGYFNGANFTPL